MRLLLLDEAWQTTGGVDSFRRALVPLLAARVEKLWWACPARLQPQRLALPPMPNLEVFDTFPPTRSPGGLLLAAARRLPAGCGANARDRLQRALSRRHLRRVGGRLGATHVFEICVFREPCPRLGLPAAGMVHDLDYPGRGASPLDAIFRDWLDRAAVLFANSSQTRAELLSLAPAAGGKIEVQLLPPAPPPAPALRREDSPWRRPEPVLYYPAGMMPRKGHAVLLAALAALADRGASFHCYLSGVGTDLLWRDEPAGDAGAETVRCACLPFREKLRARVTALGALEWSAAEQLYAAANFVVLPTLHEGFGMPLGEALRRERPVIASRIAPFEEQLAFLGADLPVRLFPAGDTAALADALAGALSGRTPLPAFSAPLRARLAGWTWEAFADRIVAALQNAPAASVN